MKTLPLKEEHIAAIREWHQRMGFDYEFPNLREAPAILTQVAQDKEGICAAGHFRKEAEAYLWVDIGASPRARWTAMQALDRECCSMLKSQGFSQIVAWVPAAIEWEFCHALMKLGYRKARPGFSAWGKELEVGP